MSTPNPPSGKPKVKAALFDIGGVCVLSPFESILAFERAHNIPHNWINYAISRSGPRGAWQRLERGEIPLTDDGFFAQFRSDLHRRDVWAEYWSSFVKRKSQQQKQAVSQSSPTPPEMDTTALFWDMMAHARTPDPIMYPTLRYLRAVHPELVLAALSNTVPFPADHPYSNPDPTRPELDPRSWFDVFVSSAEVGMRKPQREIYEYALERIGDELARRKKGEGKGRVEAGQVVFLDDIGENCKMGAAVGLLVVKVQLGRSEDAVRELGRRVFGWEDLVERVRRWEREQDGREQKGEARTATRIEGQGGKSRL